MPSDSTMNQNALQNEERSEAEARYRDALKACQIVIRRLVTMRNVGDPQLHEQRMRTLLDSIEARQLWRRMNAAKSSITWTPTPSVRQAEQELERLKGRLSKVYNLPGATR
jgi:hypothetical protein